MQLSELTVGYCGADLKALCTEAALAALRRTFPQIYSTTEKLVIDAKKIRMQPQDFLKAMESITPASQRVEISPAKSLSPALHHLLSRQLREILSTLMFIFPAAWKQIEKANHIYAPSSCADTWCASVDPNSSGSTAAAPGGRKEVAVTNGPSDLLQSEHLAVAPVSVPLKGKAFSFSLSRVELNNTHRSGVILNGGPSAARRNMQSSFSVESILSTPEKLATCLEHTDDSRPRSPQHRKDSTTEAASSTATAATTAVSQEMSLTFLGQSFSASKERVYFDSSSSLRARLGATRVDIYEEEEGEGPHSNGDTEGVDTPLIGQEACQSVPPLRALTSMEGADPHRLPTISRSRLLLCGEPLMGQTEHIGPALLHVLEGFTQHVLDMSTLYSVAMRTPEEACHQVGMHLYCSYY